MDSKDGKDGVGIDLGTTHCCLYVYKHGRSPQLLKNLVGETTTPSWVCYEKGGNNVGHSAKTQSPQNPKNTIRNAKRLIGRGFDDCAVQNEVARVPFKVINQNEIPMIPVEQQNAARETTWSATMAPEEVSATLLKYMKEIAENFLGAVSSAVVTIPANFMESQRAATIKAAKIAGFTEVTLLSEPTAAATAYSHVVDERCTILVFDFGGGTLDIAIMDVQGRNQYRVLTTDGDMYFGGEAFDDAIVQYFLQDIKSKHGVNLKDDTRAKAVLKLKAEEAKIHLSYPYHNFYKETVYGLPDALKYEAVLNRDTFSGMFDRLLKKMLEPVKRALQSAGKTAEEIDKVILVGGSTKLPAVQEALRKFFRADIVAADATPDEVIARGAAMHCYRVNNHLPANVTEVTAFHYRLKLYHGDVSELIPRGTEFPYKFKKVYRTAYDNHVEVVFDVFQSKHGFTADKFQIGHFKIKDLPARKQGECAFDVTYEIDRNNILHATAQGQFDLANYKRSVDISLANMA
ncbi:endoplasmic reticulum chaperone BiP-like [Paramacrobiotus metropolitanus]|uniref:endoplasmic reticulum chaperone BiP-like n=1 Tax=Paramacrobiotus metropolitanus TaxID=2943436 RepID=UPI00244599C2|nr:endoplasmic reticulum chaperone BiP-like [Paramacrobiotus metropolitanus]